MVKRCLFDKVICRVMKENNYYYQFKKVYVATATKNIAKKFADMGRSYSLNNIFEYNDYILILLKRNSRHIYKQISEILVRTCKTYFIQFLHENSIYDKFNFYILEQAKINNHRKDNIKSIDDFIEYEIKNNEIVGLPVNLFFVSFNFSSTDEGFRFWYDLNRKFIERITSILFE